MPPSSLSSAFGQLPFYFLVVKHVFVLLFFVWVFLVYRIRRPGVLLVGAIGFAVYTYVATTLPLNRPYAARPGGDRLVNLAMAATAATGHSAFESYQVGAADAEPFWRALMRLATLGDPENVLAVYRLLPPVMMVLLSLALYFGLAGRNERQSLEERRWELALVVYSVLLLSSSPQERFGEFQTFWAMTFLMKPNHVVGFVVVPILIACWCSPRFYARTLVTGLLLGLLGWVFVFHWGYVVLGLFLYPVVAWSLNRAPEAGRAAKVIVLSFLVVLPYVLYLWYFHWETVARVEGRVWPQFGPEEGYLNVFSIGYEHGVLFLLSLAGIGAMAERRRREDVLLLSLLSGCLVGWILYAAASRAHVALQADEFYFYTRFLLSIATGSGAFWIIRKTSRGWGRRLVAGASEPLVLALFLLITLPQTIAYWWYPPSMDRYYLISLEPVPEDMKRLAHWVRENVAPDAVFVADARTASWIAALSGRRVLLLGHYRPPKDYRERRELMERLMDEPEMETVDEAVRRYRVSHLVLEGRSEALRPPRWLRSVYEAGRIEVFEIRAAPSTR